ncbi:MAG: hypothetical protein PHE50_00005 [Dehalococcoidales bacterium]|nr:hypothetical protein [Dehalococcoidales bacterium]
MLFHEPDKSFKRLAGCWKRASRFALNTEISLEHPLYIAWNNCKLLLDHGDKKSSEDYCLDLVILDWFAMKIEEYSKDNMLTGDSSIAGILYEWKERIPVNPVGLVMTEKQLKNKRSKNQSMPIKVTSVNGYHLTGEISSAIT